jgi:hypothetical protein
MTIAASQFTLSETVNQSEYECSGTQNAFSSMLPAGGARLGLAVAEIMLNIAFQIKTEY